MAVASSTFPRSAPAVGPGAWLLRVVGVIASVAALMVLGRVLGTVLNPYYMQILVLAGINVTLAVSLNLINGITGQFSLGHAGFMAIGAYVSAYFTRDIGPNLPFVDPLVFAISLLLAGIAAGLAGLLVGLPSLRLRGDYLAIVTLGFGQIITSLLRTIKFSGGTTFIENVPKNTDFAWSFGIAALCILSIRNIADSQLGRAMRAVREDEIAAEAAGVNTTRAKVTAFVISAMWAGVAAACLPGCKASHIPMITRLCAALKSW
jgi:branched-chain amino acid transport system permease protein